jgi:hypothetical protein
MPGNETRKILIYRQLKIQNKAGSRVVSAILDMLDFRMPCLWDLKRPKMPPKKHLKNKVQKRPKRFLNCLKVP